jgi:molybdopterin-guanine dinucleotide biosynthesis protein A
VTSYAAVVLAGGRARRLGGVAKPALDVGGRPLLARVVAAVAGAEPLVVVGPPVAGLDREPVWTREEPAGAGPVAGLRAALPYLPASGPVAVLAADLPFLDTPTVALLLAAVRAGTDAAVLVDDAGRDQFLAAAWSAPALRQALSTVESDRMSAVYAAAPGLERLAVAGYGPGTEPWRDVDDPRGLDRARACWDHSGHEDPISRG